MDEFTATQKKAVAIVPKIAALISFSFAIYIAAEIIRDKKKRSRVYHRLILTIALNAIPLCVTYIWGTWAVPIETPNTAWAYGTTATCTAQGFVLHFFGSSIMIYYSSLSLYSLIAVQNNFDQKILRKFERWIHIIALVHPTFSSVYTAKNKMFNPTGPWCWIDVYPMGCLTNENVECIRGIPGADLKSVNAFRWITMGIPFIITFNCSILMVILLYVSVWKTEKDSKEASGKKRYLTEARYIKSNNVARQASLYIFVGYSSQIFTIVLRYVHIKSGTISFPIAFLAWSINPLQSFLVLFVYKWFLRKASVELNSNDDNPMSVAAISRRVSYGQLERNPVRNKITEKKHECFSIFDGSSPSSTWAEFFPSESEGDENGIDEL